MKAYLTFFIALAFALVSSNVSIAQVSLGCTNNQVIGLSDTVVANTNVSYIVEVENTGTQDLFGSFYLYVGAMDSLFNFNLVDSFSQQPFIQPFAAGTTIQALLTHEVSSSKFVEGNNTVVIWPSPPGGITTDSIFINIYVIYFNDLIENEISTVKLYPNPTSDEIQLIADELIEEVRIYNLNGVLISSISYPKKIQLNEYSSGIYLFEIKSVSGKTKKIKVIKG